MLQIKLTPITPFQVGDKLTLISVDEWMALTHRNEVQISRLIDGKPVFKTKGKRKEFYLRLDKEQLILKGWDLCKVDTDGNNFCGNACYNIVHDSVEALKEMIESKTTCEISEYSRSKIMLMTKEDFANGTLDNYIPVYPDADTNSAVVHRIRDKAANMQG